MHLLRASGTWRLTHRDRSGGLVWDSVFPNGVTYEGSHYLLNGGFRGATLQPNWFVGLISDGGFAGLDTLDTHAAHAGWSEFTGVSGSNRGPWLPTAASGGTLMGPPVVLSVTANGSVRGALLASRQPVGLASGAVLYCTGAAAAGLAVSAGGTVTLSYQLRIRPRT